MPLFSKDKNKSKRDPTSNTYNNNNNENNQTKPSPKPPAKHQERHAGNIPENSQNGHATTDSNVSNVSQNKPKLVFHCQQAQGSPTGLISGFSNVKELYSKISECYGFPIDDILFCTLNTHRVDMENLLRSQLCLEDFIFVHRKGTKKEVEITKTSEALGLTITDNGNGYSFIKRIKDGSIVDKSKAIQIGDHIERIDDVNLVGWRHVDVAKYLKGIPIGQTLVLRLIEPLKAGFANVGPRSDPSATKKSKTYGSGKETLRFRSNGPATLEAAPDDVSSTAISKINSLLENFMGINDNDLASQIWEMASSSKNTMDFAETLDSSELESFGFTDDFIIEVWGLVTDAKAGRLSKF